jgi:thymidylate kinase
VSVALLGPDGAGKSTLAAGLVEHSFLPTRSFYMDVRDEELRGVAALRVPGLTFLVYMTELWRRLLRARTHQARGEVVLFDRYVYDALNAGREPGLPRRDAAARWVHTHLLPRATLGVVLDVAGEDMYARKGERNATELDEERRRWLGLAEDMPGHLVVVDAQQPAEAVRRRVTALIWDRYAERWGEPRGAAR